MQEINKLQVTYVKMAQFDSSMFYINQAVTSQIFAKKYIKTYNGSQFIYLKDRFFFINLIKQQQYDLELFCNTNPVNIFYIDKINIKKYII